MTLDPGSPPNIPPILPPRPPLPAAPIAHRSAALYWSLFGTALFVMVMCALVSLGADMLETGTLAIIAAVAAFLPAPIYVGLFLWLDRFEPEPPHLLIATFTWGAGVAGLFACVLNSIFHIGAASMMNPEAAGQLTASLVAPPVEETLKGLAVLILFFWRKSDFDGIIDGIIYAGMAALGFATIENIQYYARGMSGGIAQFGVIFVVRGLLSPYAHVLFTSMTGIGFGLASQSSNRELRFLAPVAGWICAMALHATWNTIPLGGGLAMLAAYFVFWIPVFFGLLGLIAYSLKQESRLIQKQLLANLEGSLLLANDAAAAAHLWPRLTGNLPVLFSGGFAEWKRMRRYQRAATALAFYRQRLLTGRILENRDLENQYLQEIVKHRAGTSASRR
ncbi:MAG TPA: PrsW family intramembrane metalloprotease [Phycisphaerae bacterium]|nr:PrsW family intramembrane metalloprotease [Phycisphaerae bacterium]